jgi:integrase
MNAAPNAAATSPVWPVVGPGEELERHYAGDIWRASVLGVGAARGQDSVSFTAIGQPWLREAVKQWSRQRLAIGCAFSTIRTARLAFVRFSSFLAQCQPPVQRSEQLDRHLVERYLAWLAPQALSDSTKSLSRLFLRVFLEENRRYRWVPQIPSGAVLYADELRSPRGSLPRFIPEFVMTQLESESNLALLRPSHRDLLVLLVETGLRSGDGCSLPFNPIVTDSAGWPCLRFHSRKMRAEQLLPLSPRAAEAIRAQQKRLIGPGVAAPAWLFPAPSDPLLPLAYNNFRSAFVAWQQRIALHDEAGQPVQVTLHQLRHTLGTRLINADVPQHVIQRLLGHASPGMTAVYAHMHDSTIRAEFERYCQTRVDVQGQLLGFDPEAVTADAEWVKHQLSRAADILPNGFCGRPPQQDCPHPNACLTCPDFQTTTEFLPVHRQQAQLTREQLKAAEHAGRERAATNHRKVLVNLDKIIASLEALRPTGDDDA